VTDAATGDSIASIDESAPTLDARTLAPIKTAAGSPCLVTVTHSWVGSAEATSSENRLRASASDWSDIGRGLATFVATRSWQRG
jgi:hypothetical protein